MFCKNCGKQLPDNAQFCDGCGQAMNTAPASSGVGLPPLVQSFVDQLKALGNPSQSVGLATKSTDFTGLIGIAFYYFIYIFFNAVKSYQLVLVPENLVTKSQDAVVASDAGSFGGFFGISCAMGAISLLLMFGAFIVVSYFAFNRVPDGKACINAFGLSLIPATFAMILNFGCGFLWEPLAYCVTTIGTIFMYLTLYIALQKMDEKPVRSYFWVFCIVFALAIALAGFINGAIYNAYISADYSETVNFGMYL